MRSIRQQGASTRYDFTGSDASVSKGQELTFTADDDFKLKQ